MNAFPQGHEFFSGLPSKLSRALWGQASAYRVTGAGTEKMTGQLGRGRSTDFVAHTTRTRLCWGKTHLLASLLGNMKIPWILKVKKMRGRGTGYAREHRVYFRILESKVPWSFLLPWVLSHPFLGNPQLGESPRVRRAPCSPIGWNNSGTKAYLLPGN